MSSVPPGIGVRLSNCWVCGNLLLDSGGDPSHLRHQHHVIPSAAGGIDGPQVSLDSAHHSLLHLVADKMMSGREWASLLEGLPRGDRDRLLYLSTRVVEAFKYSDGDPNKRVSITLSMSRRENAAVSSLAEFHGLSKTALIRKLLAEEYNLRFQPGRKNT